jgi:hypothetical protein
MHRIALTVIARDAARSIERCLRSAQPWVDELLVLDTGSLDDTPQRAARCGARVAHFEWTDDFSAARNACLALTEAPWRLVLDADEWIAQGGESLRLLHGQAPDFVGQISVVSTFDGAHGGVAQAPSWLPRVLPQGVRYTGRVHEQPLSEWPRRRLQLIVGHDGYMTTQMAAKQGRNEHLLGLALAEQPQDAYLSYQLGKELEVRLRFEEAQVHYAQALIHTEPRAAWRHDLVVRAIFTLKKCQQFEAAALLAESEMPLWGHSPDFFFTLGDLLLDWAATQPHRATELLPRVEAAWMRAFEIGEQPQLQDTVTGRGSFLAAHNLAVFHESLGHTALAQQWQQREQALRLACV